MGKAFLLKPAPVKKTPGWVSKKSRTRGLFDSNRSRINKKSELVPKRWHRFFQRGACDGYGSYLLNVHRNVLHECCKYVVSLASELARRFRVWGLPLKAPPTFNRWRVDEKFSPRNWDFRPNLN